MPVTALNPDVKYEKVSFFFEVLFDFFAEDC